MSADELLLADEKLQSGQTCNVAAGYTQANAVFRDKDNSEIFHCTKRIAFSTNEVFVTDSVLRSGTANCLSNEVSGGFFKNNDAAGSLMTLCLKRQVVSDRNIVVIDTSVGPLCRSATLDFEATGVFTNYNGTELRHCKQLPSTILGNDSQQTNQTRTNDSPLVPGCGGYGTPESYLADHPSCLYGVNDISAQFKSIGEEINARVRAGTGCPTLRCNCTGDSSGDTAGWDCNVVSCEDNDEENDLETLGICTNAAGVETKDRCKPGFNNKVEEYECGIGDNLGQCVLATTGNCSTGEVCQGDENGVGRCVELTGVMATGEEDSEEDSEEDPIVNNDSIGGCVAGAVVGGLIGFFTMSLPGAIIGGIGGCVVGGFLSGLIPAIPSTNLIHVKTLPSSEWS